MQLPTEDDVLKMTPDLLLAIREQQSDQEREDILAGAKSRFEGCVRFEDLWVQPQIQGAKEFNGTNKRPRNTDFAKSETFVSAEHA